LQTHTHTHYWFIVIVGTVNEAAPIEDSSALVALYLCNSLLSILV